MPADLIKKEARRFLPFRSFHSNLLSSLASARFPKQEVAEALGLTNTELRLMRFHTHGEKLKIMRLLSSGRLTFKPRQ